MKRVCLVIWAIFIWGCGGASNSATEPATAGGDEAVEEVDVNAEADSSEPFAGLSFGERKMFMNDVVIPQMKPLFVEKHPDFSCVSCHGEDMTSINFEMPNTLAPLNPAAMPFESDDEKKRQTATFMKEQVVPTMARLLQEEPYNPDTKEGFGCFNCHATQ